MTVRVQLITLIKESGRRRQFIRAIRQFGVACAHYILLVSCLPLFFFLPSIGRASTSARFLTLLTMTRCVTRSPLMARLDGTSGVSATFSDECLTQPRFVLFYYASRSSRRGWSRTVNQVNISILSSSFHRANAGRKEGSIEHLCTQSTLPIFPLSWGSSDQF